MSNDQLKSLVNQLHTELQNHPVLDDSSRSILETIVTDIKKQIDPECESNEGLGADVENAVHNFEESHPAISKTLNSIVDTLSNMGI